MMASTNTPSAGPNHLHKDYAAGSNPNPHLGHAELAADVVGTPGHPSESSPLSQSYEQNNSRFNEEWNASVRGGSIIDGPVQRSESVASQGEATLVAPSRGGTLKKKASLRRGASLKRSTSRRSSRAGSVRSLALQPDGDVDEMQSAFYSPVPTTGNPTEILANRFQAWRKVLKDIITYFREIQTSYDQRARSLLKLSNVINNTAAPSIFLQSGGIDDAVQVLRGYYKNSLLEANKSKEIENDVILALVGLRSDLQQKIKEIKNLSGDFKNSVEKELENTRRAVSELHTGLGHSELDSAQVIGKKDPYLLRLAADRQVERQIDEENYLHQAYLNLEASGRELEAIVVGEIQKSYNAYAGILKREADGAYSAIDELRTGPITMPKDHEWNHFIDNDEHFVDPRIPIRNAQSIQYPGRDNELAQEVRAGLLERKSKYLKSYTAGWYVLSPTHLHEFKSADKNQAPIMSLYLPDQKLGSHSSEGSSSNKFMLKGRQTGSMHRGHSWVFRCESHETMLSWYEALQALTEKSPQERKAFVRQHARSISATSTKSFSSDGIEDEDEEPFSTANSALVTPGPKQDVLPRRPEAGGRFPSDLQLETLSQRGLQVPISPSSGSSFFEDGNVKAAAALPGSGVDAHYNTEENRRGTTPNRGLSAEAVTMMGLGGPAAVSQGDRNHNDEEAARLAAYQREQAALAARESSTIAAPDVNNQGAAAHVARNAARDSTVMAPTTMNTQALEAQAAREAATMAAPDIEDDSAVTRGNVNNLDASSSSYTSSPLGHMSGGRSAGEPSSTLSTDAESESSSPAMVSKPTLASLNSVSNLHVPGEYPRPPRKV